MIIYKATEHGLYKGYLISESRFYLERWMGESPLPNYTMTMWDGDELQEVRNPCHFAPEDFEATNEAMPEVLYVPKGFYDRLHLLGDDAELPFRLEIR